MTKHINVDSGEDQNAGRLEQVIDECGLMETVLAIALICEAKAEHIATNWGDSAHDVRAWKHAADILHRAAASKRVQAVS